MQIVFQDPHASLNPALTIGALVADPLRFHKLVSDRAELRVPRRPRRSSGSGSSRRSDFLDKYPGDLSGGQKQRAVLARAIILGPDLLIADEPVSALDMSVRAKILELMLELKDELDLTYVYITHDLATAKFFCDRIAIMYLGRIVELGPAAEIYGNPRIPTRRRCCERSPSPTRAGRSRATCRAARSPTRSSRRSAARSTRAARRRSRSAAGSPETCERCSRRGGPACRRSSSRPSAR